MNRKIFLCAAATILLSAAGCSESKTGNSVTDTDAPSIELSVAYVDETSVTVNIATRNADEAYTLLGEADAAAPSVTQLRKGDRTDAAGTVTYSNLEAGHSYNVFGIAGRNDIYSGITTLKVKTAGELDEHYPVNVRAWQTTADKSRLFAETSPGTASTASPSARKIVIDTGTRYQTMEGFGPAITGSTAYNLLKMTADDRHRILRDAFDPTEGMGYNYVRIAIGCSDFSLDEYTCCDKEGLENFAIHEYDRRDIFPVLHEILDINPEVKIIAAPWTAPLWMKTNGPRNEGVSWNRGRLNPDFYDDYALYFVLWIKAMEAEGFRIWAVTPQNEPLNEGNSASTYMSWESQRQFVKAHLGPAFAEWNIDTLIWAYDHNFDAWDYVTNIYADSEAAKWFEGSAWHAYGGSYKELQKVYNAAPDKSIYFTEQSIGEWASDFGYNLMWHISDVFLGTINLHCRAVVLWNFMLDHKLGPNRPNGGCNTCYGFVDCGPTYSYSGLTYRSHWYATGHLSKVVRRGASRVASTCPDPCSVFLNPDGSMSLVVLNWHDSATQYSVSSPAGDFVIDAPANSVTSVLWN